MFLPDKRWKVIVSDNFDWEDSSFTPVAAFDTREEAIAECKSRVDGWLATENKPGMQAEQLYERYTIFGEDPWVLGGKLNDPVPFRAWDYARRRCAELCAGVTVR